VKLTHFEAFSPICPLCKKRDGTESKLTLGKVAKELGSGSQRDIIEGVLLCSNTACRREHPIIDGVPILIADLRTWVASQQQNITKRGDLSPQIESLLGDCLGPSASAEQSRQLLSSYCHDHYDTGEAGSSIRGLLKAALNLSPTLTGPCLDIGCSVGGTTFSLAEHSGALTLGLDLNFSFLRVASRILRDQTLSYAKRSTGLVYDYREVQVVPGSTHLVDFWACDALHLPFSDHSVGATASLNLLDCLSDPRAHLVELSRTLAGGGTGILATPWDWSPQTPVEGWLGGHSQRWEGGGDSVTAIRSLLNHKENDWAVEGLALTGEIDRHPWSLRLHSRARVEYEAWVGVLSAQS
jgi:SAM-dependent methyltransferase/uncharacterized protein YbaR (Trm112 family)